MMWFLPRLTPKRKKELPAPTTVKLGAVFGIRPEVNEHAYVDRGQFDATMARALDQASHIAIHGASKQGKSWLRAKALRDRPHIVVHCQRDYTKASLFNAVFEELGVWEDAESTYGTELSGGVNVKVFQAGAKGTLADKRKPVGRTTENPNWIAHAIKESGKLVIIEDCHYLPDEALRDLSFVLKTLWENRVYIILAGIWTEDHKLSHYNGDLDGRVEYIHVRWSAEELDSVLRRGSEALNIQMTSTLRKAIIDDAAGNVGMIHRLAEQVCLAERIREAQDTFQVITKGASLDHARKEVASGLSGRFDIFLRDFDEHVRSAGYTDPLEPAALLQAIVEICKDHNLPDGISCNMLAEKIRSFSASAPDLPALMNALSLVAAAQEKMSISPAVLVYNEKDGILHVTDRSFFFFVRHGGYQWPWNPA